MPAQTPRGFPYPLPTEPVAEGAAAIRSLAEAVDSLEVIHYSYVHAAEQTLAPPWVDLPTPGPTVILPTAGDYLVAFGAMIVNASASGHVPAYLGATPTGQNPAQGNYFELWAPPGSGGVDYLPASWIGRIPGVAAGNEIRLRYGSDGSSTYAFAKRWLVAMRITPPSGTERPAELPPEPPEPPTAEPR
jgi:hypothetical protein